MLIQRRVNVVTIFVSKNDFLNKELIYITTQNEITHFLEISRYLLTIVANFCKYLHSTRRWIAVVI